MRGTYINTNIMMAALAGKRSRRPNGAPAVQAMAEVKETAAYVAGHEIIWTKPAKAVEKKPLYRCITACIY